MHLVSQRFFRKCCKPYKQSVSWWCRDNKGGLTLKEVWALTEGNRCILDPTGWVAEKMEWLVSYYLFADEDVSLTRAL